MPGPTCSGSPSRPATRPPRRPPPSPAPAPPPVTAGAWDEVEHAAAFLRRLAAGETPRAVWSAAPADDWPRMVAEAVATTYAAGRGALVCVPDGRDVARVDAALTEAAGRGPPRLPHRRRRSRPSATATSWPSPAARDASSSAPGRRRSPPSTTSGWSCSGTTATTCTPSRARPTPTPARCSSPGPSSSRPRRCSAASPARPRRSSCSRRAGPTSWPCPRDVLRARVRAEAVPAEDRQVGTRIPRAAYDAIRRGLESGPVLVQTPRAGYAASLACDTCRAPGPLLGVHRAAGACRGRPCRPSAGGAVTSSGHGRAAPAAAAACARRSGARHARPRSSAGCSPARPCAAARASGCSTGSVPRRTSSSRPSAPSRWPTRATPRSSCSTPG